MPTDSTVRGRAHRKVLTFTVVVSAAALALALAVAAGGCSSASAIVGPGGPCSNTDECMEGVCGSGVCLITVGHLCGSDSAVCQTGYCNAQAVCAINPGTSSASSSSSSSGAGGAGSTSSSGSGTACVTCADAIANGGTPCAGMAATAYTAYTACATTACNTVGQCAALLMNQPEGAACASCMTNGTCSSVATTCSTN